MFLTHFCETFLSKFCTNSYAVYYTTTQNKNHYKFFVLLFSLFSTLIITLHLIFRNHAAAGSPENVGSIFHLICKPFGLKPFCVCSNKGRTRKACAGGW